MHTFREKKYFSPVYGMIVYIIYFSEYSLMIWAVCLFVYLSLRNQGVITIAARGLLFVIRYLTRRYLHRKDKFSLYIQKKKIFKVTSYSNTLCCPYRYLKMYYILSHVLNESNSSNIISFYDLIIMILNEISV